MLPFTGGAIGFMLMGVLSLWLGDEGMRYFVEFKGPSTDRVFMVAAIVAVIRGAIVGLGLVYLRRFWRRILAPSNGTAEGS